MSLFPLPLLASKSALITYSTVTVRSDNQNIIWLKQIRQTGEKSFNLGRAWRSEMRANKIKWISIRNWLGTTIIGANENIKNCQKLAYWTLYSWLCIGFGHFEIIFRFLGNHKQYQIIDKSYFEVSSPLEVHLVSVTFSQSLHLTMFSHSSFY